MKRGWIGVVGAGNMGGGIAQKAATEGANVVLLDVSQEAVERGMGRIRKLLDQGVERRVFKPEQRDAILERLHPTTDYNAMSDCELVIEAVFEDLAVKREVFQRLDEVCGPQTILATNTSSFKVSALQPGLHHPGRLVGLHFFYHPAKNRLVEVIPGELSEADCVTRAWAMMEAMGKTSIASLDQEGFVVNRYFVPWLNEAVRLCEEEIATPGQIDKVACETFDIGMGPFALMNATGVPITMHAANTLKDAFGAFYAPAQRLCEVVESGADWSIETPGPLTEESRTLIASRLRGAAWLACGQLVDEGVSNYSDTDLGARVGLRWRRGPFELANSVGVSAATAEVAALAGAWDLSVPASFAARGTADFALPHVSQAVEGDVGIISMNRPASLNALSPTLLADLESAWTAMEQDDALCGVVLRGVGKAFMAGADLKFFADAYQRSDLPDVMSFSNRAAKLFERIDNSDKHVVALLDGLSLGGGSELALCADTIVSTDRGSLGFPETGIGIYPGLGGTQRSTRRVGRPVARWLLMSGQSVDAATARSIGLVDAIVTREESLQAAIDFARGAQEAKSHQDGEHPLVAGAERYLADSAVEDWLNGTAEVGDDPFAQRLAKRISQKAPLALKAASMLINLADRGADVSEGLSEEAARLPGIFATRDAFVGISSALQRARPTFEGV